MSREYLMNPYTSPNGPMSADQLDTMAALILKHPLREKLLDYSDEEFVNTHLEGIAKGFLSVFVTLNDEGEFESVRIEAHLPSGAPIPFFDDPIVH